MSGVATAVVATGVITSYSASKEAKKNRRSADDANATAAEISGRELDLAEDQWKLYEEKILPLELEAQQLGIDAQSLAQQRGETEFGVYNDYYRPLQESFARDAEEGISGQYDRVGRDAADTVNQQFDRERDISRRVLERKGVRPDSGAYKGQEERDGFAQAAARANTVNRALENERDRVEDTNFNRKAVALGRSPTGSRATQSPGRPSVNPSTATSLLNSAANGFASSANRYGNLANQNSANAASALSGGITAGANIYSQFRSQPAAQTGGVGQDFSGGGTGFGGYAAGSSAEFNNFAEGGPVLARGRPSGGEVNGPAGVDQVPATIEAQDGNTYDARLSDGEYVIPVDIVMAKGTDFFDKLIANNSGGGQKALSRRAG